MLSKKLTLILGLLTSLVASSAQAQLTSLNNGLVYDSGANVSWSADANLFLTLANASGNPANFVSQIISANGGVINDTANTFETSAGTYYLTAADFNISSGQLDWWAAKAFIVYLNSISYAGFNTWRLPNTPPVAQITGALINTSELGELFYTQLNGLELKPVPTSALFSNLKAFPYWSGTEYGPYPSDAWYYLFNTGVQAYVNKNYFFYVWPVISGNA